MNNKQNTTEQTGVDSCDVQAENEKVSKLMNEDEVESYVAIVQNLTKSYQIRQRCCKKSAPSKLAVSDLSFAVGENEVFGLLGHNGAGKSTTIKIITGEEHPTKGQVWIKSSKDNVESEGQIGYCPQNDALWSNITVREHIEIYACIRGVPPQLLDRVVEAYLEGLMISEHSEKYAQLCSGGTRRKLNFAISMIGDTSVVLLDEPSTGMDALSKRFLWNTIRNSFQGNRGAILTTHSMEEADALCTRVGIMRNGVFRCIGSTQNLKNRYGGGYILEMKLSPSSSKDEVERVIFSMFPDSTIKDNVVDRLVFNIPQKSVASFAEVFCFVEEAKSKLGIVMYSFNQTNLEQVFLNLSGPEEESSEENEHNC